MLPTTWDTVFRRSFYGWRNRGLKGLSNKLRHSCRTRCKPRQVSSETHALRHCLSRPAFSKYFQNFQVARPSRATKRLIITSEMWIPHVLFTRNRKLLKANVPIWKALLEKRASLLSSMASPHWSTSLYSPRSLPSPNSVLGKLASSDIVWPPVCHLTVLSSWSVHFRRRWNQTDLPGSAMLSDDA